MNDSLTEFVHTYAPHLSSVIAEDTRLIEHGLLDSLLLMNLIAFLERRQNLIIPDEEIIPENFETFGAIRAMIERLGSKKSDPPKSELASNKYKQ